MGNPTETSGEQLTLQVVEILHYSLDVDRAVEFYHGKLNWPVIWHAPGNLAVLDAGGVYQLTVVAAKWTPGWEEGNPPPHPRLALESKNLEADVELLGERGITGLTISGDPAQMLSLDLPTPEDIELFVWQDNTEMAATKSTEEYLARRPEAIYTLGECLLFLDDKAAAEEFYTATLGFEVKNRHGEVFTGLTRNGGPVLGLYHKPRWWDAGNLPQAQVRLFLECPDIAAEHTRQAEAGAAPGELHSDSDGLKWFDLTDPDGNVMSFWQFKPE